MNRDERRILIVDDSAADRDLLTAILEPYGYATEVASNGLEAKNLLESDPAAYDVVLLDRNMPFMNGIDLLQQLKSHHELKSIPVILQTACDSRSDLLEGLRAGALYYLIKPYDSEMLSTVVATAVRDRTNHRRQQETARRAATGLRVLQSARFSIRTIEEARDLGAILAGLCPDPVNAVIGITELLLNAVEHGNLGITYDEKTELNASGRWQEEIDRRLGLAENAGKRVDVTFQREADLVSFTIRDEGCGFAWNRYLDADPQRAFDTHGRGIIIASRLSFDRLEFRGCGNEVVASIFST